MTAIDAAAGFPTRAQRNRMDYAAPKRPRRWRLPIGVDAGRGAVVLAVVGFLLVGTSQAYTVPYTRLGLAPAQLALLVTVALWLLTRALGQRVPARLGVLSGLVVVRVMVVLLSFGLAARGYLSPDQHAASNQAVSIEIVAALSVFVVPVLLPTGRDVELVLRGIVLGGALSGFMALVGYGTGIDLSSVLRIPGLPNTIPPVVTNLVREGIVRVQGAAGTPLELAGVMTVLIPVGVGLFFAARRRGESAGLWLFATAVMLGGAVTSLSRSVFIGLGVALLAMMTRWPLRRIAGVLGSLLALAVVALLTGAKIIQAVTKLLVSGSGDYSLASRADGRTYVLRHFADHFWLGQGPGTYDLSVQPVLDNQYLGQLMEGGVLGLLLFVALLVCALAYAFRAALRALDPAFGEVALGLAGSLVALMVVNSILDTSGFVQILTLTWLLIGMAGASWRVAVTDRPAARPLATAARRRAGAAR